MLEPSLALTLADLRKIFSGQIKISAKSTIILGDEVKSKAIENLQVDGTLIARDPINYFKHFKEEFVVFEAVEESDPEIYRIRGYKPNEQYID